MHLIEILGSGCHDCLKLGLVAAEAAAGVELAVDIQQVTDPRRIEAHGVVDPPGLVIDGRLASTGRVPAPTEIADWLLDADRRSRSHEKEWSLR